MMPTTTISHSEIAESDGIVPRLTQVARQMHPPRQIPPAASSPAFLAAIHHTLWLMCRVSTALKIWHFSHPAKTTWSLYLQQ